ncbi:hypothetical protein ABZ897_59130 [Nonomuraea sp. NPDC046802]|uniref:hypothetical protein n=1 Tax=Nonomuraea sp. NPDC046802 TaxID=3154919 RepID=UPI0034064275
MFSRTKRILGLAFVSMAAVGVMAVPAQAGKDDISGVVILDELQRPFCLAGAQTGIGLVDGLMWKVMNCQNLTG